MPHSLSRFVPHVCCASLALAAGGTAIAQPYVGWRQITERTVAGGSALSDIFITRDGSKIAFVSFSNFTGGNTNGSQEIFVYDATTDEFTQVTAREGPSTSGTAISGVSWAGNDRIIFRAGWNFPTNPDTGTNSTVQAWEADLISGGFRRISNFNPNIVNEVRASADGSKVTFYSTASTTGRNELFIVDRATLAIQQLTVHVGGFPNAPRPSGDGRFVIFDSPANFDGTNTNGSNELWKVDTTTGVITAISNNSSTAAVAFQVPDAAAKSTAADDEGRWVSSVGAWNPFGLSTAANLFLYDTSVSPAIVTQISTGSGTILGPVISGDGRFLAIESQRTSLPGATNPDGNRELFLYDRLSNTYKNVTNTTGGVSTSALSDSASYNFVSLSANGKWIAYRSEQSLEQGYTNQAGGFELYIGYVSDTAAPQIGRGPAASKAIDAGANLKLGVFAAGAGTLSYAWFRGEQALVDGPSAGGGTVTGATGPRLLITGAGVADAGSYTCVVSNADGTVTSNASAVTVNVPVVPCGLSDVAGQNQAIGSDSQLTADDIIVFLGWYFGNDSRADVAGQNQSSIPDASFTADDIIVFLGRFFAGC